VAVKLWDAYLRTLRFDDVPQGRAQELFATGLAAPLPRDDYLALQDFLARHIFLTAGRLGLAVHIHASFGVPPFLRYQEACVQNLEAVLTDARYFDTTFVLIHGGLPAVEEAAYLALKPHVWLDVSAMPFLYPVPDLAARLRTCLLYAPEKVLFGTDVAAYPGVPVGPEVQHLALCRATRQALSLALAGLIRDGVVDAARAIQMGEGMLRANAQRLYGWAV
jgi:predicted TIM-barrel fold metal-dependent hydrolase